MAFKEIFLIALLIGVTVCEESEKCPSKEDIPHCHCFHERDGTLGIGCEGFHTGKTIEDYRRIMQESNLASKKGLQLYFGRFNKESKLPSNVLEGFPVKSLVFRDCQVSRWADEEGGPAFVGLEDTLEALWFRNSINKDSPQNDRALMSFGHLRNLIRVYFIGNKLYNFGNEWFGKDSPVQEVKLEKCRLSSIGNEAFAGLANLKKIIINSNQITEVTRSMFPNPANHLKEIFLERNKLTSLPEDIFSNMPALIDVGLSNNLLTHLPENVWRPVWSNLEYVSLRGNKIHCDDHLKWTFKVRLPQHLYGKCHFPSVLDVKEFIKDHS